MVKIDGFKFFKRDDRICTKAFNSDKINYYLFNIETPAYLENDRIRVFEPTEVGLIIHKYLRKRRKK